MAPREQGLLRIETGFEGSRGLKCLLGKRASELTREAQELPPWQSGSPGCVDVDNRCLVWLSPVIQ